MESPKTFVIIGNGVAAWRVNEELESKFVDARIIRIGREEFAPKCSFRTTSINCLRGTQKGISPLGDKIVDSHQAFLSFYEGNRESLQGIDKGVEHQLWDPENARSDEKWSKRHPQNQLVTEVEGMALARPMKLATSEAFFIEPRSFYQWQKQRLARTEFSNDYVVSAKKCSRGRYTVCLLSGKEIVADKLFVCAGYMSGNFEALAEKSEVSAYMGKCKPVRGTYMTAKARETISKSFSLAIEGRHLIFRKSDQCLLLGSTSENDNSIQLPMTKEVAEIYQKIKASFADSPFLPSEEEWQIKNGIRHKGAKRMPFWGEMGENCYGVFGLYKNAFSFSFLAAKELVRALNPDKS